MFTLPKLNKAVSSRRQIQIKGVRDGVLLLPGGRYRSIVETSSINFELKSEAEQDALIETYQTVLNSISCPIQILVRIREVDIDKYLEKFRTRHMGEVVEVYKNQSESYIKFVRSLVVANKILSRRFFVIVTHDSSENEFELVKEQLSLNVDVVAKGLNRLGMQCRQLSSLEVLDLFYSFYDPINAKRQPITDQTLQVLSSAYI